MGRMGVRVYESIEGNITGLRNDQWILFRRGNVGQAVRASSSISGIFQPVSISGREYVDGGLTSPIPVKVAKIRELMDLATGGLVKASGK